jgi:putative ATPase
LRDGHYGGAEKLGNAIGYQYSHDAADGVAAQEYLGVDREYYIPVRRGFEADLAERWDTIQKMLKPKE